MPVVGAVVAPHGALILQPERNPAVPHLVELNSACQTASRNLLNMAPDIVFLSTPHGIGLSKDYGVYCNSTATGSAEWDGEWTEFKAEVNIDTEISKDLVAYLSTRSFPVQGLTAFTQSESIPLRWGEVIPLWFLLQNAQEQGLTFRCIILSMPRRRLTELNEMVPELTRMGSCLYDFFSSRSERVAVLVSGDLAHTHQHPFSPAHPSPYGSHCNAEVHDKAIEHWVKTMDAKHLLDAGESLQTALSCGFTGFSMLQGLLEEVQTAGLKIDNKLLYSAHPTYYGMLVASFLW